MGEAAVGAHGIIMIACFLFLTEMAEVIAWWASNKTNIHQGYFKVVENGTRLFNAHRGLNTVAFLGGIIGMIIILATDEYKEGIAIPDRHLIYGFTMMVSLFLQIFFRVAFPADKYKWMHRWFGRIINLWAFFVAITGYDLANTGGNEGTDEGGPDFNAMVAIFCFWYFLKLGIWAYYFVQRKRGKAQEYKGVGAEGTTLPTGAIEFTTPAS